MIRGHKGVISETKKLDRLAQRKLRYIVASQGLGSISATQVFILTCVYCSEGHMMYQKDLEKIISIRKSSLATALKDLESRGLVHRESAKQDNRVKEISLTSESENNVEAILSYADQFESELVQGIPKKDVDTFFSVMEKMQKNAALTVREGDDI